MVSAANANLSSEANGSFFSEVGLSSRRGFPNKGHWFSTTGMSGLELCVDANGASISLLASSPKFFDLISLARSSCISLGARFFSLRGLRDLDVRLLVFLFADLSSLPLPDLVWQVLTLSLEDR